MTDSEAPAYDMLLAQYESCRADRDSLLEHLEELRKGERDALLFLGVLVLRLGGDVTVTFDELEAVRGRVLNRPAPSDVARSVRFYITNKDDHDG